MTVNRNITYLLILFAFICVRGYSQPDNKFPKHWTIGISGALTNYDAWEVEPNIAYNPIRYTGIGMGLLFTKTLNKHAYGGYSADKSLMWFVSDDDLNYTLALRPELRLATPAIFLDKDHDSALSLRISPGLTIPVPTNIHHNIEYIPNQAGISRPVKYDKVKNTGARICYFHLKTAFALEIDVFTLSLGYNFSNFDLYGGSRNLFVENEKLKPVSEVKYMHSIFIDLSYGF